MASRLFRLIKSDTIYDQSTLSHLYTGADMSTITTGDIHQPPVRDILIEGDRIASVTAPDADIGLKTALTAAAERGAPGAPLLIEARDHLVIPGLVNAPLSFL